MIQYQNLLRDILENGSRRGSGRPGMPPTISLFGKSMEFDLREGFPLLTTKKMHTKSIFHELLWFLKGDTNIKYLLDNDVNIWNKDCYKFFKRKNPEYKDIIRNSIQIKEGTIESDDFRYETFIELLKTSESFAQMYGDLGKIYGYQWRRWGESIADLTGENESVDQIGTIIHLLRNNPESRYILFNSWNPSDLEDMALPPCHLLYHFYARYLSEEERVKYAKLPISEASLDEQGVSIFALDLNMYQRSCDTFLGVPFNIASAAALVHIVSTMVGMEPGVFKWFGGDVHLYENHIEQVKTQLERIPYPPPRLEPMPYRENIEDYYYEDFNLVDYICHPAIKGELSVGV